MNLGGLFQDERHQAALCSLSEELQNPARDAEMVILQRDNEKLKVAPSYRLEEGWHFSKEWGRTLCMAYKRGVVCDYLSQFTSCQ